MLELGRGHAPSQTRLIITTLSMTSATPAEGPAATQGPGEPAAPASRSVTTTVIRSLGWAVLGALVVFVVNNYLTFWLGWPGAGAAIGNAAGGASSGSPLLAWLQLAAYPLAVTAAVVYVLGSTGRSLRDDSNRISDLNIFLIRFVFYMVLYVGIADAVISFLRVEGFLPAVFGDSLATELGKSSYRGTFVHMPLVGLALVTAIFSRTLGFTWLALLVVAAELLIVITRFIFSYEQAFMADLVRFWYAALFLFASAYTLLEEGHVRVDVLYTTFDAKQKGVVNAVGSILLGVSLCWIILIVGMNSSSSVINSPLLAFETTQTGFGMYVKYFMAGFLAIFAISMMIQFVSYLMDAVADVREEPGGHDHDVHAVQ